MSPTISTIMASEIITSGKATTFVDEKTMMCCTVDVLSTVENSSKSRM